MDDMVRATMSREDSDLATIVLGRTQTGDRRFDAPERVPAWFDGAPERGYDARSVAVLALVVAVLAAVIGWSTTIGDARSPGVAQSATDAPAAASDAALGSALEAASSAIGRSVADAKPTPVIAGANLAAGRLVAARSGSGTGLVTVGVRNTGGAASSAAEVLVLVDGNVMGSGRLDALAAGGSARVEVSLDWCPSGTVAIVAIIDPGSVVREGSEFDNSVSRSATFGC